MTSEHFQISSKRKKVILSLFIFILVGQLIPTWTGTNVLFPFYFFPMFAYDVASPTTVENDITYVSESGQEFYALELISVLPAYSPKGYRRALRHAINLKKPGNLESIAKKFLSFKPEFKKIRIYSITNDNEKYKQTILNTPNYNPQVFRDNFEIERKVIYEYP